MNDEPKNEPVEPEGADDIPGGSAPGGAQTRPEAQEGFGAADPGEAEADADAAAGEDDPMIDEPSEGSKGGARTERDHEHDVPDTPATRGEGGAEF